MIYGTEFIRAFNEIGDDPATGAICACCGRNEPVQDMLFVYGKWICASCHSKIKMQKKRTPRREPWQ